MRRLTREHFVTEMSKANAPAYVVEDGETVVVETIDAAGGFMGRDGVRRQGARGGNPATGPIEAKGSQPGEAIAVTIHEVRVADWGYIAGVDKDAKATIIEMAGGVATYPWGLRLPVRPVIGVIGTAPPGEAIPTTVPSDWGGNLDTVDICAGATVCLPVAVSGALLALGDVHALQGESECCGTGIECFAEVTATVRRVRNPVWPKVHVVRNDKLMVFAHSEDLDAAAWDAVADMAKLLTKLTGLPDIQARRLLSTAGDVAISQIVNPKKTCRAIIPRAAIPASWPF
ncbi:MAG: hypothetical protein FJ279_18550 [Planctomycetes bacterium]|nr:hypothetical protein [Planctomycetota bacterium]